MNLENSPIYIGYKKHETFIMAIEALCIIILLVFLWSMYVQDLEIKEEIRTNCGYGDEDYYCYCEKSEANRIKNLMDNSDADLNLFGEYNVSLVS